MIPDALGILETRGRVGAIAAADAMLKTATVGLLGILKVKGGLQAVLVTGEVAAVQAAVEAGQAICRTLEKPVSVTVIPRPAEGLEGFLPPAPSPRDPGCPRDPQGSVGGGPGLGKPGPVGEAGPWDRGLGPDKAQEKAVRPRFENAGEVKNAEEVRVRKRGGGVRRPRTKKDGGP